MNSKYKLGIIELFYPARHINSLNTKNHPFNGYYICTYTMSVNNFFNKKLLYLIIDSYKKLYMDYYIEYNFTEHYFHPNFNEIISHDNYFDIKIIEIIYENNKKIILDKTCHLKIFQKKFKKYYYSKYLIYE